MSSMSPGKRQPPRWMTACSQLADDQRAMVQQGPTEPRTLLLRPHPPNALGCCVVGLGGRAVGLQREALLVGKGPFVLFLAGQLGLEQQSGLGEIVA